MIDLARSPVFPCSCKAASMVDGLGIFRIRHLPSGPSPGRSGPEALAGLPDCLSVQDRGGAWLASVAPLDWLLLGPASSARSCLDRLGSGLDPALARIYDISTSRIILELDPEREERVLSAYTSLPREQALSAWRCAPTRFGDCLVTFIRRQAGSGILMVLDPSLASYVASLLKRMD